jgi:hypothetical protein
MDPQPEHRIVYSHEALKKNLLSCYHLVVHNENLYPSRDRMRAYGLTGGKREINRAWDSLTNEGLLPPRRRYQRRILNPTTYRKKQPRNHHPLEPTARKPYNTYSIACVRLYGRHRLIKQHKTVAQWLNTQAPASRLDLHLGLPLRPCSGTPTASSNSRKPTASTAPSMPP